jgi:hypothetical protein
VLTPAGPLAITQGRHPLLAALRDPGFEVRPNDTFVTPCATLHLLTGPNMSGKSTYLKQVRTQQTSWAQGDRCLQLMAVMGLSLVLHVCMCGGVKWVLQQASTNFRSIVMMSSKHSHTVLFMLAGCRTVSGPGLAR